MNQSVRVNNILSYYSVQLAGYFKSNQFSYLERKTSDFSVITGAICQIQCIIDPGSHVQNII